MNFLLHHRTVIFLRKKLCRNYEKIDFFKGGEVVGWAGKVSRRDTMRKIITSPGSSAILSGSFKRFRAVTISRSDSRAKRMTTFDFIPATISHNLKDPHSKALPACRRAGNLTTSPPFACDYDTVSKGGGGGLSGFSWGRRRGEFPFGKSLIP